MYAWTARHRIAIYYHISRLDREKGRLAEALQEPQGSVVRAALEEFARTERGARRLAEAFLWHFDNVLRDGNPDTTSAQPAGWSPEWVEGTSIIFLATEGGSMRYIFDTDPRHGHVPMASDQLMKKPAIWDLLGVLTESGPIVCGSPRAVR